MGWEVDAYANKVREDLESSTNCSGIDSNPGKEVKFFLLTSESYIGLGEAEKLVNLDGDCPNILQQADETNGITNLGLYLDRVDEFTMQKSLQESEAVRSFLLNFARNSRLHIFSARLVEEVYDGIENMKISGEKLFADNVFAMTERDIKCNEVINGIWEQGWRRGFSADEAERVVNKVESLLVNGLIEEVVTNLL